MKTYKSFLSFTLSLGLVFVVAYLSGYFLDQGKEIISALYTTSKGIPERNIFVWVWSTVYVIMVIQMTVTLANRCLRRGYKVWVLVLITNLLFTLTYFHLKLTYLGSSIILLQIILLIILASFYVRNTRYLWILSIPMLATYGYSFILSFM